MPSFVPRSALLGAAGLSVGLAVSAMLLAIDPIWRDPGRRAVESAGPDVGTISSMPLSAALLALAVALVASSLAFVGLCRRERRRSELRRIADCAARVALGERGVRASPGGKAELEPLASSLNRLAATLESAESMLVDRDRQLDLLRRHARVGYWETDREGRFRQLDAECSASAPVELLPAGSTQFANASFPDRAGWQRAIEAISAHRPFANLLLERTASDGARVRVLESGEPRFSIAGEFVGYGGSVRRLDAAAPLDAAARAALEASPEPMVLLADAPWPAPVLWMNPAAREALGEIAAADFRVDALLDPADQAAAQVLREALEAGQPMRSTVAIRSRTGERTPVLARLDPTNDGSGRAMLALDAREPELSRLRASALDAEPLRQRVQRLERQSHQAETFAWSVSHDLRAPLRVIDGFARIVLEDHATQLDEPGRAHLGRVLSATARMDVMIEAIVALSRVSSQPLQEIPIDLDRLAGEVLQAAARADPSRRVEIRSETGTRVRGDPALLRLLLQNLLGNAWKYTARRDDARITFDARPDDRGRTVFRVADNGIGFDMSHAERLFGAFQRLHPSDEFPGSGLGLAIAQRIVHRHGGAIWAESAPGEGSTFHFTLGDAVATPRPRSPTQSEARTGSTTVRMN